MLSLNFLTRRNLKDPLFVLAPILGSDRGRLELAAESRKRYFHESYIFFIFLFGSLTAKKPAVFIQKRFILSNNETAERTVACLKVADGGLLPFR